MKKIYCCYFNQKINYLKRKLLFSTSTIKYENYINNRYIYAENEDEALKIYQCRYQDMIYDEHELIYYGTKRKNILSFKNEYFCYEQDLSQWTMADVNMELIIADYDEFIMDKLNNINNEVKI